MNREQAVTYLKFSGFSEEQIKAIEGAFTCDKCVYSTSEGCQYDDITETIPPFDDVKCSECGNILDFNGVNCGRGDANYCPNCGARMVEPQKGGDQE